MPGAPLSSLVKYETPSLLTTKSKGAKGAKGGKKLPPVEAKQPLTQTEDILNSILPPRYAPERLKRCSQCSSPACRASWPRDCARALIASVQSVWQRKGLLP